MRNAFLRLALVLLGIAVGLALVETTMRASGALLRFAQEQRNQQTLQGKHRFRILCLGESTTAGEARYGRYPKMLQNLLNGQNLPGRVAVVNRGRTGADTGQVVLQLNQDLEDIKPDLVVIMMGINDAGRTHAYGTIIAPGADHWYGSFRLYKLYRVLRHVLLHGSSGSENADKLVVGEGIQLQAPSPGTANAGGAADSHDPYAFGELPADVRALVDREEYEAAERALRELLETNPGFPVAHIELAQVYERTERPVESRQVLLRGVAAIPHSVALRAALAHSYETTEEWEAAIEALRFLLESLLTDTDRGGHTHYRTVLADLYERSGQYDRAERELLDVVQRLNAGDDVTYQRLIDFYERRGEAALAAKHRDIQRRIRYEYINPKTRTNYEVLRDTLRARGIPFVAVQYPVRPVAALQRMLGNDPGVIYVDNGNFRKRVQADGYETYFHDEFAGDFGHLTRRGNELLAENVARTIVEQFFGVDYRQGLMPSVPTGKTDLYAPEVRGVAPLAVSVSTATRRRRRTAGLRSALRTPWGSSCGSWRRSERRTFSWLRIRWARTRRSPSPGREPYSSAGERVGPRR